MMTREAAAISHFPATNPENPVPVPLLSRSKVSFGWSFLYSAMRRGANSSPTVLEPLMTTLSCAGAGGGAVVSCFSEQPATIIPARSNLGRLTRLILFRRTDWLQRVIFIAARLVTREMICGEC